MCPQPSIKKVPRQYILGNNFDLFTSGSYSIYSEHRKLEMIQQYDGWVPVEQMYDIVNRNYEWQQFKYVLPKSYHHKHTVKQTYINRPPHKTNYIDDVLTIKKYVPAPNLYEAKPQPRPLSGKMDRSARKTLTDTIIDKSSSQKTPGPATYFKRPQTAQVGRCVSPPQFKQHYLNQVQYLSSATPGVGDYNINYFKTHHVTSPKFHNQKLSAKSSQNLHVKKSKKTKQEKDDLSQIKIAGTFDQLASKNKIKSSSNNFFGKSPRFSDNSKCEKNPGPNSYQLNYKWNDGSNLLLKTSASVANIRSVYHH